MSRKLLKRSLDELNGAIDTNVEGLISLCEDIKKELAKPEQLSDEEIAELISALDFRTMVTADDIFYLIARAVEAKIHG